MLRTMDLDSLRKVSKDFTHRIVNPEFSIVNLNLNEIEPDPNQPRKFFDEEELKQLAENIKAYGLLQPIVVRKIGEHKYHIISGERRYRAHLLNEEKTIKAIVRTSFDPTQIGYLQMAENIQRANLSTAEIAEFIVSRRKIPESQGEIADRLGLNKAIVSQYCSWSDFPETIREAVLTNKIGSIQSAYALFKTWKDYPDETEQFIEDNEKISASQAKKFNPSIKPEEPQSSALEETLEASSPASDENETTSETNDSPEESFETTSFPSEPEESEDSEESDETVEEQETTNELLPKPPQTIKVNDPYEEELAVEEDVSSEPMQTEDEADNCDSSESFPRNESEEFVEEYLKETKEGQYKKPLILCLVEGRECELLYKKKAVDGMVYVKWEDGSEEEIPAEELEINRIIEG